MYPTSATVDPTGKVTTTELYFTMRELICSLLAGNGLKLPNVQICLKANLGRLLNNAGINWQGGLLTYILPQMKQKKHLKNLLHIQILKTF